MKRFIFLMVSALALVTSPILAGGGYPYQDNNQAQQKGYYGQTDQAVQQTGKYADQYGYPDKQPPHLNPDKYKYDDLYTSEAAQKATLAMLYMVYTDLNHCIKSFDESIKGGVSAIGHLNNAQSALKKTVADPAYHTLIVELNKRISKIKFYVVMNVGMAARQRIQQVMSIIKHTLASNGSNNYPDSYNEYGNYGFENKGPRPYYPTTVHEIPVSGNTEGVAPVSPAVGNGIIPVY